MVGLLRRPLITSLTISQREGSFPYRKGRIGLLPHPLPCISEPRDCPASSDNQLKKDEEFMRLALVEAQHAFQANEVPIGAVLVHDDRVVSVARNEVEARSDPTAHAEMLCIQKGAKVLGWRLTESTLYVTLEPCPMCAGAVLQSRLRRLVYGVRSPRLGAHQSWVPLLPIQEGESTPVNGPQRPHPFHPYMLVNDGILEDECGEILKLFFQQKRERHSLQ
ncbi:hypothetical protein BSKO_03447 [Bryopsis sp. KO-2023]|nr:hypothetical protein BSKO_03447 [Bryopsis sp. KO-2023]